MISAALAAGLALTMTVTAFADEPYTAYNYDYWDDAIPSQSAYRVEKTVTGADMGLDRLSDPSDPLYISDDAPAKLSDAKDLFYDQDNDTFWVCDSGNNRILRLDTDLKVTGCYTGFTGSTEISVGEDGRSTFLNPNGIYVKKSIFDDKLYVYIADTDNSRAVKCTVESGTEMTLVQEYTKPDTKLYDSETFNPSKILADKAENIYVVCKSVNTGSVQFNKDGEYVETWGGKGIWDPYTDTPGKFLVVHSLCCDAKDHIWVCDREKDAIHVFNTKGEVVFYMSHDLGQPSGVDTDGTYVYVVGRGGYITIFDLDFNVVGELGFFNGNLRGHTLAADSKGNLYIFPTHANEEHQFIALKRVN